MKSVFRYGISAIVFVLLVLAGFTVEVASEEFGWVDTVRTALRSSWQSMFDWGYDQWIVRSLIFFGGAAVALWIDQFIRQKTTVLIPKVQKVHTDHDGEDFRNCRVLLDGHSFRNCKFTNVTLVYNGGATRLVRNEFRGFMLSSDVPEMQRQMKFLSDIDFLKVPLLEGANVRESTNKWITNEQKPETGPKGQD